MSTFMSIAKRTAAALVLLVTFQAQTHAADARNETPPGAAPAATAERAPPAQKPMPDKFLRALMSGNQAEAQGFERGSILGTPGNGGNGGGGGTTEGHCTGGLSCGCFNIRSCFDMVFVADVCKSGSLVCTPYLCTCQAK